MERSKIGTLYAAPESTYGTDPGTTGQVALSAETNGFSFGQEVDINDRDLMDGAFDKIAGVNSLPRAKVSFRIELKGNRTDGAAADISSGSSANKIDLDGLLKACDMGATYTAETTGGAKDGYVVYRPTVDATDAGPSVTLKWYSGTKLHTVTGAKGTFKISADAGRFAFIDFTFDGLYVAVSDSSLVTSSSYNDIKPPLFKFTSVAATLAAYSPLFKHLDLDLGNQIQRRDDFNSTNAIKGFLVSGRNTTGSLDPESVTEATHPFWADLAAGTRKTLTVPWGTQTGNRISIIASIRQRGLTYADDGGLRRSPITFDCVRASNNDAYGSDLGLLFT